MNMVLDQDYRSMARSLVQARGDDALDYARRYAAVSPDRNSEAGRAWAQVVKAVERLIARKERRR